MQKKVLFLILFAVLLAPAISVAQLTGPTAPFTLVGAVRNAVSVVWMFFAAAAVVCFLFAGFTFLSSDGDPKKIGQARMAVLWGLVGVVVGILAYSMIILVERVLTFGV